MRITQEDIPNKCPKCDGETDKYINIGGIKMPTNCSGCYVDRKPLGKPYEFTTDEIREGRKKYRKELYQPYRSGEFSKEFKEANPDVSRKMVKEGVITQKQYDKARNVWKGDVG